MSILPARRTLSSDARDMNCWKRGISIGFQPEAISIKIIIGSKSWAASSGSQPRAGSGTLATGVSPMGGDTAANDGSERTFPNWW